MECAVCDEVFISQMIHGHPVQCFGFMKQLKLKKYEEKALAF